MQELLAHIICLYGDQIVNQRVDCKVKIAFKVCNISEIPNSCFKVFFKGFQAKSH